MTVLVDAISAVLDVVTRAGAASGWLALSVLGTRLDTAVLLIAAVGAVLVTVAAQNEGHAEATRAALEAGGRAGAYKEHTSEVWEAPVLAPSARGMEVTDCDH